MRPGRVGLGELGLTPIDRNAARSVQLNVAVGPAVHGVERVDDELDGAARLDDEQRANGIEDAGPLRRATLDTDNRVST